ncbi:hypothetical protein RRG08_001609 [Elysia crispata]|uniref:Uncharacterized protein n=1 Tax=Elysia crispata TaxID=231223 RepID=A0AAE1AJY3_9GAST|nr:hypothetical protein RRG08_001609 [Elysia crispata]
MKSLNSHVLRPLSLLMEKGSRNIGTGTCQILTILTREVITVDPGGLTPFPDNDGLSPLYLLAPLHHPLRCGGSTCGGLTRSDRELRPSELSHSITVAGVTQSVVCVAVGSSGKVQLVKISSGHSYARSWLESEILQLATICFTNLDIDGRERNSVDPWFLTHELPRKRGDIGMVKDFSQGAERRYRIAKDFSQGAERRYRIAKEFSEGAERRYSNKEGTLVRAQRGDIGIAKDISQGAERRYRDGEGTLVRAQRDDIGMAKDISQGAERRYRDSERH